VTYLLSQIFISLLLAAVAGAAIGWILHGYKANQREQGLRTALERQAAATAHAQQERQMIADDYDDMKLGLESRLGEMQYENRQIPALQENLEKSQQLVQQMIEKHKSEIDELATSNNDLHGQVDTLKSTLSVAARKDQSDNNYSTSQPADKPSKAKTTASTSTRTNAEADRNRRDTTSEQGTDQGTRFQDFDQSEAKETDNSESHNSKTVAAASQKEVSQTSKEKFAADDRSDYGASATTTADLSKTPDLDTRTVETHVQNELFELETEIEDMRLEEKNIHLETLQSRTVVDEQLPANDLTATATIADNVDAKAQSKKESARSASPAKMFNNSGGEHDELQNIHGIGPVIEQSLNDIGITNYKQIASLTRLEIEEIADILNIFPGRIERDNWIGNARKLLDDPAGANPDETTQKASDKEDTIENA